MGVGLTLQATLCLQLSCLPEELFPTSIVERGGLFYSWSRFCNFHFVSDRRGTKELRHDWVFLFIAAAI